MEFNKRTGYIYIKTQHGHTKKVFDTFKRHDWVIGAWTVTGDYDLIVWVNAKQYDDLYNWANTIKTWEGIDHTNSQFVHNGYLDTFDTINNTNGVWVQLRTDRMDAFPTQLKDYDFVGGWANMPGEYDFLLWITGKTTTNALENVLRLTENKNWRTYTHVPVYTYVNTNYKTNF